MSMCYARVLHLTLATRFRRPDGLDCLVLRVAVESKSEGHFPLRRRDMPRGMERERERRVMRDCRVS